MARDWKPNVTVAAVIEGVDDQPGRAEALRDVVIPARVFAQPV